jgi:glutamate racemase
LTPWKFEAILSSALSDPGTEPATDRQCKEAKVTSVRSKPYFSQIILLFAAALSCCWHSVLASAGEPLVPLHVATFDSGFGGYLTAKSVEREAAPLLREYAADITIHHYGDTRNLPYGEKTPEQIAALGSAGVLTALREGADVVFIACNTASTQYERIRRAVDAAYPGEMKPVISIIDASAQEAKQRIDAALATQRNAIFVILATPATVRSMVYPRKLAALYGTSLAEEPAQAYTQPRWFSTSGATLQSLTQKSQLNLPEGRRIDIYQLAPANWVEMIEHGADLKVKHDAVQRDLALLRAALPAGATPDVVGYFCTHYPILDGMIRAEMAAGAASPNATSYIAQGQLMATLFKRMAVERFRGHERVRPISDHEIARLQERARATITISGSNSATTSELARTLFPGDPAPQVTEEDMGTLTATASGDRH